MFDLIKEFNLVTRTAYTVLAAWFLSTFTMLSFSSILLKAGWFVFGMSFIFQYWAIHPLFKTLKVPKKQFGLLSVLFLVSMTGVMTSFHMMPQPAEFGNYQNQSELVRTLSFWTGFYLSFAGLFIGSACTSRAWLRYYIEQKSKK